jgi:hypothetical protein
VSSRLATDHYGRLIAVGTCVELQGLRWLVLGDTIAAGASSVRFFFLADETRRASRPANARERQEAQRHAPYRPALSRQERERQQVPDSELAEQAAIELARKEQQREPVHLVSRGPIAA